MMEPTGDMVAAGEAVEPVYGFGDNGGPEFRGIDAEGVFQAMLTAALNDIPQT
jgi:hypothetical protein